MKALEGTWMGEEGGIVFYEPMEKNGFSGSATIIDDGDSKDGEYEIDDKAKRLNLSYSDGWGTPVTAMYTYDLSGKELELTLVKYKDVPDREKNNVGFRLQILPVFRGCHGRSTSGSQKRKVVQPYP